MRRRCGCSNGWSQRSTLSTAARRAAGGGDRRGFTLVELMVAMLIMTVGLLGMTSTAAVVSRQMRGSLQQSTAAQVAQTRLEWLRAISCKKISDSSTTTRGIQESWHRTQLSKAVMVTDSVRYTSERGITRSQVYTTMVPCA
ncbi:MAG TPA: prepilin-type N-terminal cleavage/methylation domain-containing protein [Gemmatimonadaceae bacterium]|nr:prepilin-type N-terminal cleavage/methylation domain-containing protein [Gemmatimonadaceae bacterium]